MSEAVENTEVLTSDISTVTEQDNVEQQETTGTGSPDRSQERVAIKSGFNQLSFKRARFQLVAEDTQMFMGYMMNSPNMQINWYICA